MSIEINTSGRNGWSESYAGYGGIDGKDGGDGDDAKDIRITLSVIDKMLQISGTHWHQTPLGNPMTKFILKANGGNGGDGGAGGVGFHGRDGYSGSDATKYTQGGDGGDGEPGGDGGVGGNGGNGGDGGEVVVRVLKGDEDLLLTAPEAQTNRGVAGERGKGGSGGNGGKGGWGGNSYTWQTESEWIDEFDHRHIETQSHTQPGGSRGRSAVDGRNGRDGVSGRNGKNGSYTIQVVEGSTVKSYQGIYKISMEKFDPIRSSDGIIEPGERLYVHDIVIANNGMMPSPQQQPPCINVKNNLWIQPQDPLEVRQSIPANHTLTMAQPLSFYVKENFNAPTKGKTFKTEGIVQFSGYFERVNKPFNIVPDASKITIRYPVQISLIANATSITKDEEAPFAIKVKNISSKPIGIQVKRVLGLDLQVKGGIPEADVSFTNYDGENSYSLSTLLKRTVYLEGGEERIFSGTLKFTNPKTAVFTQAQLEISLILGKCNQPLLPQTLHIRDFKVQLSEYYTYNPNSQFLLVSTCDTDLKTIQSWKLFATSLGTSIGVWDASLYAGISLTKKQENGKNFLEMLKGKTIIFLNAPFQVGVNKTIRASEMLDKMELFRAMKKSGISTYLIGDQFNFTSALTPLMDADIVNFKSVKAFLKYKNQRSKQEIHYTEITKKRLFKGKEKQVMKEADAKLKRLQREFPKESYTVFYKAKKFNKWEITFHMRPIIEKVAHIAFCNHSINQFNEYDIYNVFKLFPFEKKLNEISNMIKNEQNRKLLRITILSDLVDEVAFFYESKWRGSFDKKKLDEGLTTLQRFMEEDFTVLCKTKEGKKFLKEILLPYHYLAKKISCRKDKHLLPRLKRRRMLSKLCLKKSQLLLDKYFPNEEFKGELKKIHSKYKKESRRELIEAFSSFAVNRTYFDHHRSFHATNLENLPDNEEQKSTYTKGINKFGTQKRREAAIVKQENECVYD